MNESQFQESIDTFKVRFEGINSIDAELFTKIINNTVELVKASSRAIDPNASLRLGIKSDTAATKGTSFELIVHATGFNKTNNLASDIITGVLDFLRLKSHLKGKMPRSILAS